MVSVIFPAAGEGRRMNAGKNKVLLELMGKPILVRTLLRFSECPAVDDFLFVVGEEDVELVEREHQKVGGLKPFRVVAGGSERQYSVRNGIAALHPDADVVLVHDAARPLVSVKTIEAVTAEAWRSGAAIAAVRAKNTIKVVRGDGVVESTPERANLWEVQTPQGFRRDILEAAGKKQSIMFPIFTNGTFMDERYFELFDRCGDRKSRIDVTGGPAAREQYFHLNTFIASIILSRSRPVWKRLERPPFGTAASSAPFRRS